MKTKALLFSFLVLIIIASPVFAYTSQDAADAINKSENIMSEMISMNFSVSLVNDTLNEAKQLFVAQDFINKSGGTPDFSIIIQKTTLIEATYNDALTTHDELTALESTLNSLSESDRSLIQPTFNDAMSDFINERYADARTKIELAYSKLSEQQALSTKLGSALEAGRKNLSGFLYYNWPYIVSGVVIVVVIVVFFGNSFLRYFIRNKVKALNVEKNVIVDLIKDTQRSYFDKGKISEDMYTVRVKKFEEMIRDIDRQLPLLREELENRKGRFFLRI